MKRKRIILIASLCAVLLVALTLALLGKFVFGWFDSKEEPYVRPRSRTARRTITSPAV